MTEVDHEVFWGLKTLLSLEVRGWFWPWFPSVGPELEDLAEPGGGARVHQEGAFMGDEVFPVPAAERGQTVDRNKALIALPPEDHRQELHQQTPTDTKKH